MAQLDIPQLESDLNAILARVFPTPRMPAYRYYLHIGPSGSKDRYFWTTESVESGGKTRYASGVYRYLKTKKQYKLVKECYHAKRKDAKARALKLYEERA